MSKIARWIRYGFSVPAILILSLIAGGVVSLALGQDANWDIKNYHIHNAWALLNDRMRVDILAAGIQTYFNPLLDLPYYKLAIDWLPDNPRLVAFLMGLPAGILLFFVWLCTTEVIRSFNVDNYPALAMSIIAVLIGMTGAATVSQWGTTFNEIQIAALVVAGLYVIIRQAGKAGSGLIWLAAAGLCLGGAAALKLTATIYAPGAFLAIVLAPRALKAGVLGAIGFSAGWWAGFLALYGWWGYRLYDLTGNPMFPMFNTVFKSALIGAGSGMDDRFTPTGIVETVFYPFHWLSPHPMVVAEPEFADPRFALAYLAVLIILSAYIYYRTVGRSHSFSATTGGFLPRQAAALVIWLVVSYLIWQSVFSIFRYAIPIEAFTGLLVLIAFLSIARILNDSKRSLPIIVSVACVGVLAATCTQYPQWGRVNYGHRVFEIDRVALPNNSLVIFNGRPIAYLAPFLARRGEGISFLGIVHDLSGQRDYPLWQSIGARIREHAGKIYMVERANQSEQRGNLAEFGLSINQATCKQYKSNIDQPFTVCELHKSAHI